MLRTPLIERLLNTTEINKILVEKLLDGYEKGQAEGESLHITDGSNLPMILRPQGQVLQVKRNGYNVLNITNYTDSANLISSIDNEKVVITSKKNSEYNYEQVIFFNDIELKAGTTYTLSKKMEIISGTPFAVTGLAELYKENSWIKVISIGSATEFDSKASFNVEEDGIYRIRFKFVNAESAGEEIFSVSLSNLMIYEGSEEKEYEEYGQMPSTSFPSPIKNVEGNYKILNRNKNYFNFIKNVDKQTYIGITTSCYSNTIKANGTSTQAGSSLNKPIQFLKKGYYKVSINLDRSKVINIDNNKAYAIYFRDSEKNVITGFASNTNINSNISVINLKLDEDITLTAQLFVNAPGITFNDLEIKIQIEKVEEGANTDIVEPELKELNLDIPEGIKLYGKEDGFVYLTEEQATELKVDGEGWYTVNNYNERDFSKEPLLTGKTAGPFVQGYYIIFDDIKGRASLDGNIIYSTHQKQKIPANPSVDAEWLKLDGNLIGQLYPSTHIGVYINYAPETKQEFVDWFNNLAPIIIYPLKKPAYTKITDKNFIKQLEELQKVFSHEGITNIDTYSTDSLDKAPLIISAEYLKSQKIINKRIDERLTALENALINNI